MKLQTCNEYDKAIIAMANALMSSTKPSIHSSVTPANTSYIVRTFAEALRSFMPERFEQNLEIAIGLARFLMASNNHQKDITPGFGSLTKRFHTPYWTKELVLDLLQKDH